MLPMYGELRFSGGISRAVASPLHGNEVGKVFIEGSPVLLLECKRVCAENYDEETCRPFDVCNKFIVPAWRVSYVHEPPR